ncbi:hypothetical protein A7K69_19380 [Parageobacillus thermoglucosidasius]|uniref:Phospholipase A2 domain-containing protein n=2 Tax=Anoxybacillaceae TaxID=3120669 RepID=A0A1B7KSE3_PARTM|nr:hypothetical protein A7K69_19380 [Parageobacillus thermoglucosidasius]
MLCNSLLSRFANQKNIKKRGNEIMQGLVLVGSAIKPESVKVQTLLENPTVANMVKKIKQYRDFADHELEVFDAYQFEGKIKDRENSLKRGEGAVLALKDQSVSLNILFAESGQEKQVHITGFVIQEDNDKQYFYKFQAKGQDIKLVLATEFDGKIKEQYLSNFDQKLFKYDENFKYGILDNENEVEAHISWKDGCLPGGYKWCGGKCHNYPDSGGDGSVINEVDACCMLHDYCYRYDWNTVDGCDDSLCECVKPYSYWAALFIQLYFCD